jgi:glutathione S-transferase
MSSKMKLHWSPKSPYVRKVMICLHELGLEDRVENIRSVAAMLKPNPSIMQDNPLSKIPTLTTADGIVLYDSIVICEYLNTLGQGQLFPQEPTEKWQALRWHALGDGLLDALILWRNEREREHALPALIDAFSLKFDACLNMLDTEVNALSTSSFNVGILTLGCALGYADYRFAHLNWQEKHPDLANWYVQLCQRPSFELTAPVDG